MNNKEPEQLLGCTSKREGSYFLLVKVIRYFVVPILIIQPLPWHCFLYKGQTKIILTYNMKVIVLSTQ